MLSLIELREINEDNYEQCFELNPNVECTDFVDSVIYSLAEAWVFHKDTRPYAIYKNKTMIGFVSMYVGEENFQIINFMIDGAYQNKGLGTEAAKECIRFLQKEFRADRVSVPVNTENTAAKQFWSRLGFEFSDKIENGYVFMRLNVSQTEIF